MNMSVWNKMCQMAVVIIVMALLGGQAVGGEKKKELSDKAVRTLAGIAYLQVPDKIKDGDGKVFEIDKSDPKKIIVPVEDARHIIKVARLSAHAQICDLADLQAANYLTMMAEERAKKKWSKVQMLYISRLHLFTVMWLTGKAQVTDVSKDGKKTERKTDQKQFKCSKAEREKVRKEIEHYVSTSKAVKRKKKS